MRTSNKTIMVVLGVGVVLALAGQALAQSGSYRGRDGFRGGSDSRTPFIHRGFTGGYAEYPRHFTPPRIVVTPRMVAPWWLGYSSTVYVAPPCGLTGRVFVAPPYGPRYYPSHRYAYPAQRYYRR